MRGREGKRVVVRNRKKKKADDAAPRRPAYYWWFLANTLALCFALVSWILCLQIFGNPEMPRNYAILKKLDRLPELKRYTVLDVPNGNSLSPTELYAKYFGVEEEKRRELNSLLLRNYLQNFEKTLLLSYVEGEFEVAEVKKLGRGDFFYPGFALRAQAKVKPDDFTEAVNFPLVIEYVFPTDQQSAVYDFAVGDILEVSKNPNCAAVIHVARAVLNEEEALQLTVIPIAYGPYRIGQERTFTVEPPEVINPGVGLPIWR